MGKYLKFTVYLNLIIAVLSAFMAFNLWGTDRNKAYLFVFLALVTAFMFFFRRHYLKKFQERKKNQ
ncbi:MAG: hypothetical protein AB3N16_09335 [Flavobacteriaceae bacterium]